MIRKKKTVLSWSSGKDSAWALYTLQLRKDIELAGFLTTFNEVADRVAMHAVRRQLVERQAEAADLPLTPVMLPWPCSNKDYKAIMESALVNLKANAVTHIAFGDLYLEEIREYREKQLKPFGLIPMFPIWHPPGGTKSLAQQMIKEGLMATLTCVNPEKIDSSFVGTEFNSKFLAELPESVDPCGENGEYHTFCYNGPMFGHRVPVIVREKVLRDGFWFADITSED